MRKEDTSYSLSALVAGAAVGAVVGLLFAPRTGSQFRSSLREYAKKAKDQMNQATKDSTQWSAMPEATNEEGVHMPTAEGGTHSAQKDHTIGDTGQDN